MIMCDSGVDRKFAKDLMQNKDVKYLIKLPGWFKVETHHRKKRTIQRSKNDVLRTF